MKKRRIFLLSSIFTTVFFVFFLSSSFFTLSVVEVNFYDENNEIIDITKNKVLNSYESISSMVSVAKNDVGKSMFLVNKNKYFSKVESSSPYAQLIKIESKFPNKLIFIVKERTPIFYLEDNLSNIFLLDKDFKILKICKNYDTSGLVKILNWKEHSNLTFFDFFDVSQVAFSEGQFLAENNLVIRAISKLYDMTCNFFSFSQMHEILTSINLIEESEQMNLLLQTSSKYGIKLKIEGVLEKFEVKFNKLLKAFKTLESREKIKTTYGTLIVNNSLNCIWNKL